MRKQEYNTICLAGRKGCGKTSLMTLLIDYYQSQLDYHVYTNYKLKGIPYTYFDSINVFENTDISEGNIFGIDELGKSAGRFRTASPMVISLVEEIHQSRKISSIQTPTKIIWSTQLLESITLDIKSPDITDSIWKPHVIVKDALTNRPLLLSVEIYVPHPDKLDRFERLKTIRIPNQFYLPNGEVDTILYDICDKYDTQEKIKSVIDTQLRDDVLKHIDNMPEEAKSIKMIYARLRELEPAWTNTRTEDVANNIKLYRKRPDLLENLKT